MSKKGENPPPYGGMPSSPQPVYGGPSQVGSPSPYQQSPYGAPVDHQGYQGGEQMMAFQRQQQQGQFGSDNQGYYGPQGGPPPNAYHQGPYPPGPYQQGPYQQGPYPPGPYQQGPYQQGGYYQQQNRGSGGFLEALCAASACCCCLELCCLF